MSPLALAKPASVQPSGRWIGFSRLAITSEASAGTVTVLTMLRVAVPSLVVTVTSAAFAPSMFAAISDTTRIAMLLVAPQETIVCDAVVAARRADLNSTRVGLFTFGAAMGQVLQWYEGRRVSTFQRLGAGAVGKAGPLFGNGAVGGVKLPV